MLHISLQWGWKKIWGKYSRKRCRVDNNSVHSELRARTSIMKTEAYIHKILQFWMTLSNNMRTVIILLFIYSERTHTVLAFTYNLNQFIWIFLNIFVLTFFVLIFPQPIATLKNSSIFHFERAVQHRSSRTFSNKFYNI